MSPSIETVTSLTQLSLYYNSQHYTLFGYKTGVSILAWNASNVNNVDNIYHVVLDISSKSVSVYNPITKNLFIKYDISGYSDNFISGAENIFIGFFTGQGNPSSIQVTPDVQSFKYQPCVEGTVDLYSSVDKNINNPFLKGSPINLL